jgi:hypothetical protein
MYPLKIQGITISVNRIKEARMDRRRSTTESEIDRSITMQIIKQEAAKMTVEILNTIARENKTQALTILRRIMLCGTNVPESA